MTETLPPSPSSFSLLSADPNLSAMASNHDDPQTPTVSGDDFHSSLNNDLGPDDDRLNSPSDGGASTISSFGDAASSLDPNISPPSPKLLYLSFNQDASCFAAGTDRGFRVYNCSPFSLRFRREAENGGGIGIVQMLLQCNIFVMVGDGSEPQNPSNKVMVWDDHNGHFFGELSFRSEVKSVRFRRDRIVVVTNQKICVYNFTDFKLLKQIETTANPKGLCEVSYNAGSMVLVCPGLQKGQVRIEHYSPDRSKIVVAHDSKIACLALACDGRYLATASSKGTLVRIFNTEDGSLLQEVRRGASTAEIYSLALSPSAQWLAVSSDTGTVHVFSLKVDSGPHGIERSSSTSEPDLSAPSSSRSFIKGVLPKYFSSEWSVARFHLKERSQYIVAFGQEQDTVLILGMDGSLYHCRFDAVSGGEMTQLEYHNFLTPEGTL